MRLKAHVLVLLLLTSVLPVTSSAATSSTERAGPEQASDMDTYLISESYSMSVQSALARVTDLTQYSLEQLEQTSSWVAIGHMPVGEHSPIFQEHGWSWITASMVWNQ